MLLSPNTTVVLFGCFEQLEMAITRRGSASLTERLHLLRRHRLEVARNSHVLMQHVRAIALRDQQQVILRTLLDPQSLTATPGRTPDFVATDPLLPPQAEPQALLPELIKGAWERRPDVQQARLQVSNGERQVASAVNAAKPEIDLYGSYESRGL